MEGIRGFTGKGSSRMEGEAMCLTKDCHRPPLRLFAAALAAAVAWGGPALATEPEAPWEKLVIKEGLQGAWGLRIQDVDLDGLPDLVAGAREPSDRVVWCRQPSGHEASPGAMWQEYTIDPGPEGAIVPAGRRDVATGDIDGDGDSDVAVALHDANAVVCYLRPPDPRSVRSWPSFEIGRLQGAQGLVLADVDGDGDLDAVAAGTAENAVVWFENPGVVSIDDRPWPTHMIDDSLAGARGVFAIDIDRDGLTDAVATGSAASTVAWYKNPGPLVPIYGWPKYVIDGPSPDDPSGLALGLPGAENVWAGDLSGDGFPDVAATGRLANTVVWYEAPGLRDTINWVKRILDDTLEEACGVTGCDIDRDGDSDVVATGAAAGAISWYENPLLPDAGWRRRSIDPSAGDAAGVASGDIDGDAMPDVAATACREGTVAVYRNPIEPPSIPFIRGDAHMALDPVGDPQKPDVTDLVSIASYLAKQPVHGVTHFDAADANDDGFLTFEDFIRLGRFLYVGPPTLPEPFPEAGDDPTPDTITHSSVEPPPSSAIPPSNYKIWLYWVTPPNSVPGDLAILRLRLHYPFATPHIVPPANQAHAAITFNAQALEFREARALLEGWDRLLVMFNEDPGSPSASSGMLGVTFHSMDPIQNPRPIPPDADLVEFRFVARSPLVAPQKLVNLVYTVGEGAPAWLYYYTGAGYFTTDSSHEPEALEARFEISLREVGSRFVRGDANADSAFNLADAICVLMYLFASGPKPPCLDAADANDDGQIDVGDAIYLLAYQFMGGPPPPKPFGHIPEACGLDPTHDRLPCDFYGPCYEPIDVPILD